MGVRGWCRQQKDIVALRPYSGILILLPTYRKHSCLLILTNTHTCTVLYSRVFDDLEFSSLDKWELADVSTLMAVQGDHNPQHFCGYPLNLAFSYWHKCLTYTSLLEIHTTILFPLLEGTKSHHYLNCTPKNKHHFWRYPLQNDFHIRRHTAHAQCLPRTIEKNAPCLQSICNCTNGFQFVNMFIKDLEAKLIYVLFYVGAALIK